MAPSVSEWLQALDVEHIYVISLARRTDRRRLLALRMERAGIASNAYTVIDAVDGRDRAVQRQYRQYLRWYRRTTATATDDETRYDHKDVASTARVYNFVNSVGAFGLLRTYQALCRTILAQPGDKRVLILEDDCCFAHDFVDTAQQALRDVMSELGDYDVIRLGANQQRWEACTLRSTTPPSNRALVPRTQYYDAPSAKYQWTMGLFAVALSRRALRALDAVLRRCHAAAHWCFPATADLLLWKVVQDATLLDAVLMPNLVIADVTESDNMGARDMLAFARQRAWELSRYALCGVSDVVARLGAATARGFSLPQYRFWFEQHMPTAAAPAPPALSEKSLARFRAHAQLRPVDVAAADHCCSGAIATTRRRVLQLETHGTDVLDATTLQRLVLGDESDRSFVFIVPSYNNRAWVARNLESICAQTYPHWRAIYVDDCSDDGTLELARDIVARRHATERFLFLRTPRRMYQAHARYVAYNHPSCQTDEVAVLLDGDDWLLHARVLEIVNRQYRAHRLLVSYGQFRYYDDDRLGALSGTHSYPPAVVAANAYRAHPRWVAQHLRTAEVSLLRQIPASYLQHRGAWIRCCTDIAEMMLVLELSEGRHRNIGEPLVAYNKQNSCRHPNSFYNQKQHSDERAYRRELLAKYLPQQEPPRNPQ